ncbi:hypothetical protein KFV55_13335 (plasmid) [Staphylococcus epidermidis]|nr:hypothetical protein KFV55_13335 [Staphylococcus epidermidis]
MINYGNNSNRSKLKRYLEELQQLNRISIEENHVIDPVMSEIKGHLFSKTNVYSIKKSFNQNSHHKVLIKADEKTVSTTDILIRAYQNNVINYEYIKDNLTRRQLRNSNKLFSEFVFF